MSATPQADLFFDQGARQTEFREIPNVPFVNQTAGHCGPAALTMALKWAGAKATIDEVSPQVFTPGVKGSYQLDMISAARRNGMMALPLNGLQELISEIEAGHPVIVFENLALSWLPRWHYAVVFGYDLKNQTVRMHSGPEAFKLWDIRKFERSWKLGDYWGLVVLPPGMLSASASELSHVRATAVLEQIGKIEEAQTSYQSILQRWPQSLAAHVGLANIAFSKNDAKAAENLLLQAVQDHPESASAWFNLSVAQNAQKKKLLARKSAERALSLATVEQKPAFEKNLKDL